MRSDDPNLPKYLWLGAKQEVIVFRDRGKLRAFSSLCPHMGGQLRYDRRRRALICPWHGLCFDLATGTSNHCRYRAPREFQVREVAGELRVEENEA